MLLQSKTFFFTLLFILYTTGNQSIYAQDRVYGLYEQTSSIINPATGILGTDTELNLIFRRFNTLGLDNYNSLYFQGAIPLSLKTKQKGKEIKKLIGGVFGHYHISNSAKKGIYHEQNWGLGYLHSIQLNKQTFFQLGIEYEYQKSQISIKAKRFSDIILPYIKDDKLTLNFHSIHAGSSLLFKDKNNQKKGLLGIGIQDVNTPNRTFLGKRPTLPTVVIQGDWRLNTSDHYKMESTFFHIIQSSGYNSKIGFRYTQKFRNNNAIIVHTNVGDPYHICTSIRFRYNNFIYGLSYTQFFSDMNFGAKNMIEFGIYTVSPSETITSAFSKKNKTPQTHTRLSSPKTEQEVMNETNTDSPPNMPNSATERENETNTETSTIENITESEIELGDFGYFPPIHLSKEGIYFEAGSTDLHPDFYDVMDELAIKLKQNPKINLTITGHTDNTGDSKINKEVSEKRTKSVAEYLSKKGISLDRITTIALGETDPLFSNDTSEGRAKNRRVSFSFE